MPKKMFSFNLDTELRAKLIVVADRKYMSQSALLNQILQSYLESIGEKERIRAKVKEEAHKMTEVERLEEWAWRKKVVKEGKFPIWFAEEFAVMDVPGRADIHLDGETGEELPPGVMRPLKAKGIVEPVKPSEPSFLTELAKKDNFLKPKKSGGLSNDEKDAEIDASVAKSIKEEFKNYNKS